MNLNEQLFQMMREGRKYSAGWISKRFNIPLSSVQAALSSLVKGGVIESTKSKADGRRRLYETRQRDLIRLCG
ncbi:MAG: MarR family transcriptional regulator [Candidatus Sabulitectum sp.]|nr:MarR family transcriptional regulator [Candidatus Sabulitectum sp.]